MSSEAMSPMKEYVARQSEARLDRFAYELGRGCKSTDADTVHDLRVSIRRYESCVDAFNGFFPPRPVRKFDKRLREILKPAGIVRDRDIALQLASDAGLTPDTPLVRGLSKQRQELAKRFQEDVKRWSKRNPSDKWRRRLVVSSHMDRRGSAKSTWDPTRTSSENAAVVLPSLTQKFFNRGLKLIQVKTPDKKLHDFRLRAKRFRYTLELFKPCYGPTLDKHITAVRRLQDHLGTMNDCAATLALLRRPGLREQQGARRLRDALKRRITSERADLFAYWESHFAGEGVGQRWMGYLERYAGRVAMPQGRSTAALAADRMSA